MRQMCPGSLIMVLTAVFGAAAGTECVAGSVVGKVTDAAAARALLFHDVEVVAAPEGSLLAWRGAVRVDAMPQTVEAGGSVAVLLDLPIAGELAARIGRTVVGPRGGVTWYGTIDDGSGASFVMARVEDAVAGAIWHPTYGTIEIRPTGERSASGERQSLVLLIDPEAQIACGSAPDFGRPADAAHAAPGAALAGHADQAGDGAAAPANGGVPTGPEACGCGDDGSVIDIMVVYTPPARDGAGGTAAIEAIAMASVASINTSFGNSGLADTQVRLVHMHETDFMEAQDVPSGIFRNALSRQGDGIMDEVGPLRDQYGADLVALLVQDFGIPGLGGMAFVSPGGADRGFSVTRSNIALGPLVFAHEVGHNFGCQHDIDAYDILPDQYYALGHKFTPPFSTLRRTIMAYNPGARIPHFSNPDVSFGGLPTGLTVDGAARRHNARVISETKRSVANFRQSAEAFADCNRNGVSDATDIAAGHSQDLNGNGMPDECEVRLYVDASAPAGGDGLSWASAFNDLTDAIGTPRYLCDVVTEVWVAEGTYRSSGPNNNKWDRFFVGPHLRLLGGFAGVETNADQRNPATNVTVLTGDRLGDDLPGWVNMEENSINVVRLTGLRGAVIDGFTIRDGYSRTKPGGRFIGGGTEGSAVNGVWSTGSIFNCIIEDNFGHWGTVLLGAGEASVVNTVFRNNRIEPIAGGASTLGAGLFVFDNSDVTVVNSTIAGNVAVSGVGGAIAVFESRMTIENSVLWGNPASLAPAPVFIYDDPTTAGSDVVIGHSVIEFGQPAVALPPGSTLSYGGSNTDSDPMFIDASAGDLTLDAASPGIDAGDTTALDASITRDIAGNARIAGLSVDMGAHELSVGCAVDLNGDLAANFFDVLIFLGEYGIQSPIGDWNADGQFSFFDVTSFLAAFNAGCP